MNAALVPSPAQERTDRGVGASSAAAAIGVSDYRRPIDAWLEATGRAASFEGNEKTRWGQALEPVIRAHYVEKNGVAVHVPPTSLFHRELPFVRATPDGIVLDARGEWLFVGPQVKNVGLRQAPNWADGNTPADYLIQGVVEMAVCDLPRIDFAVLIGGQEYREVTIERDEELEAEVIDGLRSFWRLVETDTQPVIDDSKSWRSFLLKQIKRRVTITASEDAERCIARWREVAREIKSLKSEEQTLKNLVCAELAAANANAMKSSLGNISIGNPRKKTKWKAVVEQVRPLATTLALVERELTALLTQRCSMAEAVLRIEDLRDQLRLATGLTSVDALITRNTTLGDPSPRRPNDWTKDVGLADDDEHEED